MNVVHVVGTRPNFPKAGPVMRAVADRGIDQLLIHTGQHYDDRLDRANVFRLDVDGRDVRRLRTDKGQAGQLAAFPWAASYGQPSETATLAAHTTTEKLFVIIAALNRVLDVTPPPAEYLDRLSWATK